LLTPAPGGRLLFPAIVSTSTLLAFGLLWFWPAVWRGRVAVAFVILLAVVALATLLWELQPLFALPRTYAAVDIPDIQHRLEADFVGEAVQFRLVGYDTEITGEPPHLDVTFYWQALGAIAQDYALAIQLTSPVPGDDTLRFNYNTWPGRGNYPTSAWPPGRIIADRYRFKLPDSDAPTQAWQLLVVQYETTSGERLSVRLDGQDVGQGVVLTTLRVPGQPLPCPDEAQLDDTVYFGPRPDESIVALTGAFVRPNLGPANPGLRVSLCWDSLEPTPVDYTVFVHLYDENGELLATGDGPPMNGAFPTGLWQPGDAIVDTHAIPVADAALLTAGTFSVGVGLYDLNTGDRVPAFQGDRRLLNDVVMLKAQP
jgi:hypothetical protein